MLGRDQSCIQSRTTGRKPHGVSLFVVELHAKRFELITELIPQAKVITLLANPNSPQTELLVRAMQETACVKGGATPCSKAATAGEIHTALAALVPLRAVALTEQSDPFFVSRRAQFA